MLRCSLLVILLCFATLPVFAAENMGEWSHSALIQVEGNEKYKGLFLPEGVYEHVAPGLSDVRIVDNQGNFVPFYIQNGTAILRQNDIVYNMEQVDSFKKIMIPIWIFGLALCKTTVMSREIVWFSVYQPGTF